MKKLAYLSVFSLVLSLCAGLFTGCTAEEEQIVLNVYNWGEYIADGSEGFMDINAQFEKETGIKVNYKTYESNEAMYTLLKSGAADYDVVIPSEYMIGKMVQEGMLAELNPETNSNIPNYAYIDQKYKDLLKKTFSAESVGIEDINNYCVPYTWGTIGIYYNKKYVDEEDLAQGWDILWNEKYKGKICMFDNARDSFAIAMLKLGYSINTTDEALLEEAYQELVKQKPLLYGYYMDQTFQKMTNEECWLAPYYSGDGAIMMDVENGGNENIGYFVPHQGTNFFVDAMCVLKDSKNKEAAEMYINFMCRADVAKANAEYIGYSTPHKEALQLLEPEVRDNKMFYPDADVLDKTEMFVTLPEATIKVQKDLWIDLKSKRDRWWWPF